jgi:putative membrane protein insertion efficiency factor
MSITLEAEEQERTLPADLAPLGPVTRVLLAAIRVYQGLRAGRPTGCRYLPTCSAYADEAIRRFGPVRGTLLAARRLSRCHPWGGHGVDPVPDGRTA